MKHRLSQVSIKVMVTGEDAYSFSRLRCPVLLVSRVAQAAYSQPRIDGLRCVIFGKQSGDLKFWKATYLFGLTAMDENPS
jgi:hypothetical protein